MNEKSKNDKSVSSIASDKPKKETAPKKSQEVKPETQIVTAVEKRRRYPLVKLLVILLCMAIAAGYVWQLRQIEVDKKVNKIETLKNEAKLHIADQKARDEETKALEAKFTTFDTDNFSMKILATWKLKSTQFPEDEIVIGDENTTIRVITSETRNSGTTYIPKVDYLWEISDGQDQLEITKQSLHCERFDTFDNQLPLTLREHNGFKVYCDTDGEKVVIAALAAPEKYGTEKTNSYFIIEINEVQQVNFDDIVSYLESYVAK